MTQRTLPLLSVACLPVTGCISDPPPMQADIPPQPPAYATEFETDPFEEGWFWDKATWENKRGEPGNAEWVERRDGGPCLEVQDGMWRSPRISLAPLTFVHVHIESKAASEGYWGLLSYDTEDVEIPASPYSQIPGSQSWITNDAAVLIPEDSTYSRVLLWPRKDPIRADGVVVTPVSRAKALEIGERTYSQIPPVDPSYEDSPRTGLSHTLEALRGGGELTILLLGDSVSNDMANGNFQLLLERHFQGSRVTLLNKVGSGAGAKAFLENDRIGDMIAEHEPDLVMFGGISNTVKDIPAIRRLAARVKEHGETEFLVFSGTMLMPRYWENYQRSLASRTPYRDAIRQAAEETGFGFCDLGGAWETYAQSCGKPVGFFRRDHHHANERGKQAYAHLLAAYLVQAK